VDRAVRVRVSTVETGHIQFASPKRADGKKLTFKFFGRSISMDFKICISISLKSFTLFLGHIAKCNFVSE
jgi:hypothetical protein